MVNGVVSPHLPVFVMVTAIMLVKTGSMLENLFTFLAVRPGVYSSKYSVLPSAITYKTGTIVCLLNKMHFR